jgi:multidrug efflux pump subunit AcrB
MSQKGTRTNLVPAVLLLVGLVLIIAFDQITHQDAIAIIATIALCSAVVARWLLRGRRF